MNSFLKTNYNETCRFLCYNIHIPQKSETIVFHNYGGNLATRDVCFVSFLIAAKVFKCWFMFFWVLACKLQYRLRLFTLDCGIYGLQLPAQNTFFYFCYRCQVPSLLNTYTFALLVPFDH